MKQQIVIIDYGMGNIHSVKTAIRTVAGNQTNILCSNRIQDMKNADKLVFPGVGAIKDTIRPLKEQGLAALLPDLLCSKPSLAICVGLQALAEFSEENHGVDCLCMIPARVKRFHAEVMRQQNDAQQNNPQKELLKIPHIGWNQVQQKKEHPLWHKIQNKSYFYFVHSYYLQLKNEEFLTGTCHYGMDFPAALSEGSLFATQFHPEKSDTTGLQLMKNFLDWDGR